MDTRKYHKEDPFISTRDVEEDKDASEIQTSPVVAVPATRYSKGEGIIEPSAFFVVFSNGTVREKDYFSWMRRNCPRLRLEFFGVAISPDDLLKKVLDKKKEYDETASDALPDKFYTLTDVDHFYNDIVRSKEGYRNNDVQLIVSNPCFEVWLYYSKLDDRFDGFEIPDNPLKLSQAVKRFLNV